MTGFAEKVVLRVNELWSATGFAADDLTVYSKPLMAREVRRGVRALGVVSLLLLSGAALLYQLLGFNPLYSYTCGLLGMLALHVTLSAHTIKETRVLYLLSMTLLVVSGSALVMLAHQTGSFSAALLSSVVLLFMVIPLVPWGLREALAVILLIYLVFTGSTLSVGGRFDENSLWLLQFMMLGSGLATLTIVARNVGLRKDDIRARFELENARQRMERLSYEDGLTGAWNRRFLDTQFNRLLRRFDEQHHSVHFALLDIDDFKQLNDTRGHAYGDATLKALVRTLRERLDEQSYVFRVGGDEFALLFDTHDPKEHLATLADDVRAAIENRYGMQEVAVSVSIGVIEVPKSGEVELDELYQKADKALYLAKRRKHSNKSATNLVSRTCTGDIQEEVVE